MHPLTYIVEDTGSSKTEIRTHPKEELVIRYRSLLKHHAELRSQVDALTKANATLEENLHRFAPGDRVETIGDLTRTEG